MFMFQRKRVHVTCNVREVDVTSLNTHPLCRMVGLIEVASFM